MEKLEQIINEVKKKQEALYLSLKELPGDGDVKNLLSDIDNIKQEIAQSDKNINASLKAQNLLSKIIHIIKARLASSSERSKSKDPSADTVQYSSPCSDRKKDIQITPEADLKSETISKTVLGISKATKVQSDDCPSESTLDFNEIRREKARNYFDEKVRWWMSHKDFNMGENPYASIRLLQELPTTHPKTSEPITDNQSSSLILRKSKSSLERMNSPPRQSKRLKIQAEKEKFRVAMSSVSRKEKWKEIVEKLGGTFVESAEDATVLLAEKFIRTVKILVAVARGVPIVGPDWLEASEKMDCFLEPWDYLLHDPVGEQHFAFHLKTCLKKALARQKKQPLLAGRSIFVTKNVKPPPDAMKAIVESCGGSYIDSIPKERWPKYARIISCQEDAPEVKKMKNRPTVVKAEWIMRGILVQRLENDDKYELAI